LFIVGQKLPKGIFAFRYKELWVSFEPLRGF